MFSRTTTERTREMKVRFLVNLLKLDVSTGSSDRRSSQRNFLAKRANEKPGREKIWIAWKYVNFPRCLAVDTRTYANYCGIYWLLRSEPNKNCGRKHPRLWRNVVKNASARGSNSSWPTPACPVQSPLSLFRSTIPTAASSNNTMRPPTHEVPLCKIMFESFFTRRK